MPATAAHAAKMAAAAKEMWSAEVLSLVDPDGAIHGAVDRADFAWAGEADGEMVALWGVQSESLLSRRGYCWLLTTPAVEDHLFTFVRYSRIELARIEGSYDLLYGFVDAANRKSMRWLEWLGFTLGPLERRDNGFAFHRFEKRTT